MKAPWARAVLPLLASIVGACGDSSGGAVVVVDDGTLIVALSSQCPRCDDDSDLRFFGRFGFTPDVTHVTARSILAICGFEVARGHDGLSGDTFQLASCGGGVELAFVSNQLGAYRVAEGYQGVFRGRIRIGDDLGSVLAAEPGLVQVDPLTYVRDDGTVRIEANFDADLRLRELIVGRGFLR